MSFDKLSESLGTSFVPATSAAEATIENEIENEIQEFEKKKNEIAKMCEKVDLTLEDKDYLQMETRTLIQNGRIVLDKLQGEIKQGSSPRMYEVYSVLLSTIMTGLRELRELNKLVLEIEKRNRDSVPGIPGATLNVFLTSKDMVQMLKKAKQENSLNAVDGEFKDVVD